MAADGSADALIIPTDRLFTALPALHLNETQANKYRNGVKLDLARLRGLNDAPRCRVYDAGGDFIGLADADRENGVLRVYKNL